MYIILDDFRGENMRIDLRKIRSNVGEKLTLNRKITINDTQIDPFTIVSAPLSFEGLIENHSGVIHLSFSVSTQLSTKCNRCGIDMQYPLIFNQKHILVSEIFDEDQDNEELLIIENEFLDIDEIAEQSLILNIPTKILCSENCQGICPQCGKNLNEVTCGCSKKNIDPRLSGLSSFLE